MKCRHCGLGLQHVFLELGSAPLSNRYLNPEDLRRPETYYPLRLFVCDSCWLVQTEDHAAADEIFDEDYAYFSSVSRSWLEHAARYCAAITKRLALDSNSFVVEVASNDGYLLRNFVQAGIPCLGIEPTASTAAAAESRGIAVVKRFFGEALARELASQGREADLVIGNNVYAHVPDINDFTRGLCAILKPSGTVTLEFPHLMRLIEHSQFDTVYHEHFSYLSLGTVSRIFERAGLRVFDVEELPTHGGSLRVYGCRSDHARSEAPSVRAVLDAEARAGLRELATYSAFQTRADRVKDDFVAFLIECKRQDRSIAAYGAAAKGNTLLNYAGIRPDLLPFVCDAAPSKQGRFMPGSRIPILAPSVLEEKRPDYVLILPWNIAGEVKQQLANLAERGSRFVTAIPTLEVT
jgi:SAM-dependent methyltransferase